MIGNKIQPFKIWCQKVLPNVYDDSLSYYEYLCKMNEYLNEVIEQMNTLTQAEEDYQSELTQAWNDYKGELTEEWNETKAYIDNYFDNLNVQNEINHKLDVMASDGSLDALLLPYFNEYKTTINQIFEVQNGHISNVESQMAILEARVDEIAELPEGSTSGDAELADIRIGANGITYNSAGNAVRGQVTELIDAELDGKLDYYPPISLGRLVYSTGAYESDSSGNDGVTDYLKLSDYVGITLGEKTGAGTNVYNVFYYDENLDFIYPYVLGYEGYELDMTKPYARIFGISSQGSIQSKMQNWFTAEKKTLAYKLSEKNLNSTMYVDDTIKNYGSLKFSLENGKDVKSVKIYGKTLQSGTGNPTPNNARPISGVGTYNSQTGKYDININITDNNGSRNTTISVDSPLYENDYVDIISGKVHRETVVDVLDNTTTIYYQELTGGKWRFWTASSVRNNNDKGYGFCDKLLASISPISNYNDNTIVGYTTVGRIYIICNQFTTAEAFMNWLLNNTIRFVHYRETPVEEDAIISNEISFNGDVTITAPNTIIETTYELNAIDYVNKQNNGIIVGINGDYTSLLVALKCTDDNLPIYVDKGTYDLIQEYTDFYGSNFWENYDNASGANDSFIYGLVLKGGRKLTFDSGAKVTANYTGTNDKVENYFSAFAPKADFVIDNLYLEYSNIRYAVHDDFAGQNKGTNHFKNCIFDGTPNYSAVIGGGCGYNNTYIVENCLFKVGGDVNKNCVSYHNNKIGANAKSHIIVTGCNGNGSCAFYWYGITEEVTECMVSNNRFKYISCSAHSIEPHDVENMHLTAWNNVVDF